MSSTAVTPVLIAVLYRNLDEDHVEFWMQVRHEDGLLDGLLEFPGGKIIDDEAPVQALKRELVEEVGLSLEDEKMELLVTVPHEYKDRKVLLFTHLVDGSEIELPSKGWFKIPWRDWQLVYGPKIPAANLKIIENVLSHLKDQL